MKWVRKYPVLLGVAVVSAATLLRFFGAGEWAEVLTLASASLGLTLEGNNAPVTTPEVAAAVAGLTGVFVKIIRDLKKRNGQGSSDV